MANPSAIFAQMDLLARRICSPRPYCSHLGNLRLKGIGLDQIFPKSKNPYAHLELIAGVDDETTNRSNNFEVTSINYKTRDVVDGWDDI